MTDTDDRCDQSEEGGAGSVADQVVARARTEGVSLTAKGLTSGEICALFADTSGQTMRKDTISRITDKTVQTCVIPLLRNTFTYAARQNWDQLADDISRSTPHPSWTPPRPGTRSPH